MTFKLNTMFLDILVCFLQSKIKLLYHFPMFHNNIEHL